MFYESLFNPSIHRPVKACLTGAGEFGASFLFQAQGMPLLEVPAVCTRTVQRAVDAYENAGIPASKVRVCESAEDAKKAYADGFNVVVDRFDYIADLPLDVLVESSGAPEASAAAAELAIERGMHVVMVSKETDSVVGSILARKAAERGLVYTTGDGDQPSLLIGLISWGRVLGMNIVGAGKSSEYDFIYDPARDMVLCPGQKQEIATPGMGSLWQFGDRPAEEVVGKRRAMLTSLSHRSVPDLCEMAVVANATGMMPDCPLFHAPVARIDEMPDLFCPKADGGLFDAPGRLDIFNCFRRPDEASMAGGVFIVVECKDKKSWQVLKAKGHPCSRNDRYAALYHPAHLLGVETGTSVLAAALMKHATGGDNLRPLCDLCGRAVRDLPKGTVLDMGGHHHTIDGVEGVLNPAAAIGPDAALPFYLLSHRTLCRDVPRREADHPRRPRHARRVHAAPPAPRTGQGIRPREITGGYPPSGRRQRCRPLSQRQTGSPDNNLTIDALLCLSPKTDGIAPCRGDPVCLSGPCRLKADGLRLGKPNKERERERERETACLAQRIRRKARNGPCPHNVRLSPGGGMRAAKPSTGLRGHPRPRRIR